MENTGTQANWVKGHTSKVSGKWPKKAFNGILKAVYPTENDKGTKIIMLEFEEGYEVPLYGLGNVNAGIPEISLGLDAFVESLNVAGIEDVWGLLENTVQGFATEPSLIGNRLWLKPLPQDVVGDDQQTKKGTFFGILEKYEALQTAAPAKPTTKKPSAKPTKTPEATKPAESKPDISSILLPALSEPKSVKELFELFEKKIVVADIRTCIANMKVEGFIEELAKAKPEDPQKYQAI